MTDLLDPRGSRLNESERRKHLVSIEKLTEQSGVPQTEVGKLYQAELERILESTRIRDFLPILIARKVKQNLRDYQQTSIN